MEHGAAVMLCILLVQELGLEVILDVFGGLHNEAGRAHSGVTDLVLEGRLHQLHHHADDVARGAELAIGAGGSHLAQDVLIDIAHRVPVVHIQRVDAVHNLHQRARVLDQEHGVLHEAAVGGLFGVPQVLDERENVVTNRIEQLGCLIILEDVPAEGVVRHIAVGFRIVPGLAGAEGGIVNLPTEKAGRCRRASS